MPPTLPYIMYGTATDADGNLLLGATITARNLRTGEEITTITDGSGIYEIDCANFSSGYVSGDLVRLTCSTSTTITVELYFSVDGGVNWQQVENNVSTDLSTNSSRFKLNKTLEPGGKVINLTLIA